MSRKTNKKEYIERDFSQGTIRLYEGKNKSFYGTISLDCGFAIRIRIVDSKNGYFISYPSRKNKKGEYVELAFCYNIEIIQELNEIIDEMIED